MMNIIGITILLGSLFVIELGVIKLNSRLHGSKLKLAYFIEFSVWAVIICALLIST